MAKHDQRPDKSTLVCVNCKAGKCGQCVDLLRVTYTEQMICKCEKQSHGGEAVHNQIRDPESGSIYGPHAVIKEDGTVTTDEEFKKMWREQFGDPAN